LGQLGDNIKMNLKETEREDVDWFHMDRDKMQWRALVNTIMKLRAR